ERAIGATRALEQERRTTGLHRPVDDLRDLQVRVDLRGDPDELALPLEERDPVAEIARLAHEGESTESAYSTASSSASNHALDARVRHGCERLRRRARRPRLARTGLRRLRRVDRRRRWARAAARRPRPGR